MKKIFVPIYFFAVTLAVSVQATITTTAAENPNENTIRLLFIDENGKPVDKVPCTINAHAINGMGLPSVKKESDAEGKIVLDLNLVGGKERGFQFYTYRDHYVNIRCNFSEKYGIWPIPDELTIVLEKGRTIGGTVVGLDGKPIAGATVRLGFLNGEPEYHKIFSLNSSQGTVTTDSEGRWSCDKLPIQFRPFSLAVKAANYEEERFSLPQETLTEVKNAFEGKLQLQCEIEIEKKTRLTVQGKTGKIVDEEGKPVSNARIWFLPHDAQGKPQYQLRKSIKTESDGFFQSVRFIEGETFFYIVSPDYAPLWTHASIRNDGEPLAFTLQQGTPIRFHVIDMNGQPVSGIKITVDGWLNDVATYVSVDWIDIPVTDSEGRTVWNHAPKQPMNYSIKTENKNYLDRNFVQLSPDKEHELKLYPPLKISGEVVDAETNQPIKMSEVSQSLHGLGGKLFFSDKSVSCNEGTFQMNILSYQDKIFVRASADNYCSMISREIFPDEQNVKLRFELIKDIGVSGTILTPDGKPAANATVILYGNTPDEKFSVRNGEVVFRTLYATFAGQFLPPNGTTNAEGKFRIPSSDLKDVKLHVYHDTGYAVVEPQSSNEIRLHEWATVKGVLRKGKETWANQSLKLYFDSGEQLHPLNSYYSYTATTDKEGCFVFNRVLPGENYVLVRGTETKFAFTFPYLVNLPNQINVLGQIKPEEGRTTELQLGGNGQTVCGKLSLKSEPQGPAEGWKSGVVALISNNSTEKQNTDFDFNKRVEKIEKDGSFRFENIPSGTYRLRVGLLRPTDDKERIRTIDRVIHSNTGSEPIVNISAQENSEPLDLGTIEISITLSPFL